MSSSSHSQGSTPLKYRPDIDGLRAVAVLAVVGFHAFPKSFRGGYVGVDVFFVISGFLISGIIFQALEQGNFSLKEFYVRRIRRIFPALFVVLTACYALGWWLLFADEFAQLTWHIGAGAGFVANLALWSEAGYFDSAAETKPLLHLWSLGIEEQFYFIWPFLLSLTWRRFNILGVIISLLIISFAVNLSTVGSDSVAAFYSPISRFWELLIGAVLAYLTHHQRHSPTPDTGRLPWSPQCRGPLFRETKSAVGLCLIITTVFALGRNVDFPGWWPVLPTLGTCLIISAGPSAWVNRSLLSGRIMVGIGLISYPLYLWHWPLLTFARIVESRTPAQSIRVSAVLISFALAWFTYRWVENPVRRSRRDFALALLILVAAIGSMGMVTTSNNGFPSAQRPLRPIVERGLASDNSCVKHFGSQPLFNYCKANSDRAPEVAVIGDSHAHAVYDGIIKQYSHSSVILAGHTGCPPLMGTDVYPAKKLNNRKDCQRIYQQILPRLEAASVGTIFVVGRGPFYLNGGPGPKYAIARDGAQSVAEAYYLGLRDMLEKLRGKRVFLLVDNPRFDHTPLECARRFRISSPCDPNRKRSDHDQEQAPYLAILRQIVREFTNVNLLDPTDFLCGTTICSQTVGGTNVYADTHHLSRLGGEKLIQYFVGQRQVPRSTFLASENPTQ